MIVQIGNEKYTVSWNHIRHRRLTLCGGMTDCFIADSETKVRAASGRAVCSAQEKSYVKSIGRRVSLARALKDMGISKKKRKEFWRVIWGKKVEKTS